MNLKLKSIEKHELLSVSQRPERVWSLGALGGPAVCSPGQGTAQLSSRTTGRSPSTPSSSSPHSPSSTGLPGSRPDPSDTKQVTLR